MIRAYFSLVHGKRRHGSADVLNELWELEVSLMSTFLWLPHVIITSAGFLP